MFSANVTTVFAQESLERLGNEAAASADSLYEANVFIDAAQKYEEAFNLFVRAEEEDEIPLTEKIEQMLANMVTSYYQGEDYENAIRVIGKRLDRDPGNHVYARQIAQIYERLLNNPSQAKRILESYEENYDNYEIRRTLARLFSDDQEYSKALEWYQKAFEMRQDPEVLQNIALLHHRLGNTPEAIEAYEDYLETKPRESILVNVYRNMGKFYEDIGNEEKSIEYYKQSNRLRYNRDITLLLLAKYYERGDYLNARDKANKLLSNDPNNVEAHYYHGLMLFEEERYAEAKSRFEKIVNDRRYGAAAQQYIDSIESM